MNLTHVPIGCVRASIGLTIRTFARLLVPVLSLGPFLLILLWGGAYMLACYNALTGEGGALVYRQTTPGGTLVIRTEQWTFDARQGFAKLTKVTLRDPEEGLLASVGSVSVTGLRYQDLQENKPLDVRAEDAFAMLHRDETGAFDVERFIPPSEPSDVGKPVRFRVRNLNLKLVDDSGPRRWARFVRANEVAGDLYGPRFLIAGEVHESPIGPVPIRVSASKSGILIETSVNGDLTEVIKHLQNAAEGRANEDFRNLRFSRLAAQGPAAIFLPSQGPIQLRARMSGQVSDALAGDYGVARARFAGSFSEEYANLELVAKDSAAEAKYVGYLNWGEVSEGRGTLVFSAPDKTALPKFLPKLSPELLFRRAQFTGAVAWRDGDYRIGGNVSAQSLSRASERISGIAGLVAASPERVTARIDRGVALDVPVKGAFSYEPKSQRIAGYAHGLAFNAGAFARTYGVDWISGSGQVTALVTGTLNRPQGYAFAQGRAKLQPGGRAVAEGPYRAMTVLDGDVLRLRRFAFSGDRGDLSAVGTWNLKSDRIEATVFGGGFPLGVLSPDLKGSGIVAARILGTSKGIRGEGQLEAYGIEYAGQEVPFLQSNLALNSKSLDATNLVAVRGSSKLTGMIGLRFKDRGLSGRLQAQGLQLADLLGQDFAGTLNLEQARLRGTWDSPIVEGSLVGAGIVAKGVRVGQLEAKGVLQNQVALLDELTVDGDALRASGSYNLQTGQGLLAGQVNRYALEGLGPLLPEDVQMKGLLSGDFSLLFQEKALRSASAKGQLQDVNLNRVPVGGGSFDLNTRDDVVNGQLMIGTLESFIEVTDARYGLKDKSVGGNVNLFGIPVETLAKAARPYLGSEEGARVRLPVEVISQISQVTGTFEASAKVARNLEDPSVTVDTAALKDLKLEDQVLGNVALRGERVNRKWTIDDFTWTGGPGSLTAKGTVEEHGNVNIEGEWRDVTARWFSLFEPRLASAPGAGEVLFNVEGQTKSPEVTASLAYRSGEGAATADPRRADALLKVKEGSITLDGSYFFDGFTGAITGSAPFRYPFELPRDGLVDARVTLPKRDIKELAEFFPALSKDGTEGEVNGEVRIFGPVDDLKAFGAANLTATKLALQDFATGFLNFKAGLAFDGENVNVNASGDSTAGGNFRLDGAKVALKDWQDLLSRPVEGLLEAGIEGNLNLDQLRIFQNNPKRLATGFDLDATLDGRIGLRGTVKNPTFFSETPLLIDRLRARLPSEFASGSGAAAPIINPSFSLDTQLGGAAVLQTSTGNFYLGGGARIRGTLEAPDVRSALTVDRGTVNLPNAKISLEPGGEIVLTYRSNTLGDSEARADVDLVGRTGLTAPGTGGQVERYSITLNIRGDLLREGGLTLNARSDPPGLSQDRILNLLGQGDILTSGNTGGSASRLDRQLQTALTQIALPALVDNYTSQIATKLGLDYFAFEYNPFENLSVTVAKSLGRGFTLQYRRQLSEPNPGERPRYDLRLYYRPPFRRDLLGRFSFSMGLDQDRPWKISVEYGFKF